MFPSQRKSNTRCSLLVLFAFVIGIIFSYSFFTTSECEKEFVQVLIPEQKNEDKIENHTANSINNDDKNNTCDNKSFEYDSSVSIQSHPRILYLVGTTEVGLDKAHLQLSSWMSRVLRDDPFCDVRFFSDVPLDGIPDAILHPDTKFNETHKNGYKEGRIFDHIIHSTLLRDFDWFFKVDDDSYIIHENVVRFLKTKNPQEALFFGRAFQVDQVVFPAGGAGYVVSREVLQIVKDDRFNRGSFRQCSLDFASQPSDTTIAKCLKRYGIFLTPSFDSRDPGERFHPFSYHDVFKFRSEGWWLESHSFYGYRSGRDCCATHSLSFHYIGWELTRALEILLYGLNPIFKRLNLEVPDAYPKRAPIYIQVFKLFFEEQGWELEENSPVLNAAYFQDLNFSSENFHSRLLRFKNPPFFNCPKPFRSSYPGTGLWNKSLGVEAWKCGPMNNGVQVDLRMALMHSFPATREVLQDERLKARYYLQEIV